MLAACNKEDVGVDTITPDNIPDETFYKYLLDNFDTNKDGKLSVEEANAVKEINFEGSWDNASLKGIEFFRNLETLYLSLTYNVDTLNLSGNTVLKELYYSRQRHKGFGFKT